jgi:HSP20 family protein
MNNMSLLRDNFFRDVMGDWVVPSVAIRPLHGRPLPDAFPVDLREDKESYFLEAELPGLSKDDIKIDIETKQVGISAEIKQCDRHLEDEKLVQRERYFGSVSRWVSMPSEIDTARASASYKDGVLSLVLPKQRTSSTKRLLIG